MMTDCCGESALSGDVFEAEASDDQTETLISQWRHRVSDVHVAGYNDEYYDDEKVATFYLVFFNDNRNFVKKRYSNFRDLYDKIQSRIPSHVQYKFPNKSMFNTAAKFTKERRKVGFDELLQILVQGKEFHVELMEFLELAYQYDFVVEDQTDGMKDHSDEVPSPVVIESSSLQEQELPKAHVAIHELDLWPYFSLQAIQGAGLAASLLYALLIFYGYVSIAKTSAARVVLTIALMSYFFLLLHRIAS